jgi:2-oxoglutarate ferredoxin oxidoreductase subunit delta
MSKRFRIEISSRFCKGCALCVEFCQEGNLYIEEKPNEYGIQAAAVRQGAECNGCTRCAVMCPDAAIQIVRVDEPVPSETGSD